MNDLKLRQLAIILTMAKAVISFVLISKQSYTKTAFLSTEKGF
jgi:hypothetical protein